MTVGEQSRPFQRDEICDAIAHLHDESEKYWASFETPVFFAKIGDAWSPSENVRHLTKSIRAVTRGLRLPRLFIRIAFRTADRPSRSYEEMRAVYRAALSRGGKAGKYAPAQQALSQDLSTERARIMAYHSTAVSELCSAASEWTERDLDRLQMPHPLMGPLTVREMLLFTLYHNSHHVEGVRARLARVSPVIPDSATR